MWINKNTDDKLSKSDNDIDATFRSKIIFSKYYPKMSKYRWGSIFVQSKRLTLILSSHSALTVVRHEFIQNSP